ncbi:hypothetical protein FEDK69T_06250 [Flavobacterium enshiense DK69]|nr:hypothetical protein [Flavobacterium enshiense]ESU24188.1 hypothetical protein FEDK69T_06250 [Flavobacterium enshiense DK69]
MIFLKTITDTYGVTEADTFEGAYSRFDSRTVIGQIMKKRNSVFQLVDNFLGNSLSSSPGDTGIYMSFKFVRSKRRGK